MFVILFVITRWKVLCHSKFQYYSVRVRSAKQSVANTQKGRVTSESCSQFILDITISFLFTHSLEPDKIMSSCSLSAEASLNACQRCGWRIFHSKRITPAGMTLSQLSHHITLCIVALCALCNNWHPRHTSWLIFPLHTNCCLRNE